MKKIFSTTKKALFYVYGEIALVMLIFIQLYLILGMEINDKTITYFNSPISVSQVLLFILTILFLTALYFIITLKDPLVKKIHKNFSKIIFGKGKEKFFGIDREITTLVFFEFIFAMIIATAIYIYLDPEINLVPWPFNYIAFTIVFLIGFYIFSQTRPFREAVYGTGIVQKKIMPAKRLFSTKRITSPRGVIRISRKKIHSIKKTRKRK